MTDLKRELVGLKKRSVGLKGAMTTELKKRVDGPEKTVGGLEKES